VNFLRQGCQLLDYRAFNVSSTMATEKFCLKWNDFESNISGAFKEIRDAKDFFDVTLACDDDQLQAHKVILSACSPFFRAILKRNPHQHPLLYLKGVKYSDLQSVLNFMYHGEVNVAQDELNSFLAVAEELRVKGLTQNNQSSSSSRPAKEERLRASPPPPAKSRASEPSPAPPAKRPRPNPPPVPQSFSAPPEDDDIQEVVPVKSEPRDNSAVSALADSYGGGGVNTNALTPANDHQLATDEDANYDESYEDYGGYGDQSYDASMMDPNMTGDTNKGMKQEIVPITGMNHDEIVIDGMKPELNPYLDLETNLESLITKNAAGYTCNVCGKHCQDRSAARNHVEALHVPSSGHNCDLCGKFCKTKNALNVHMYRNHSKVKQAVM